MVGTFGSVEPPALSVCFFVERVGGGGRRRVIGGGRWLLENCTVDASIFE